MTILAGQTVRRLAPLEPLREKYVDSNGCSCGLSIAGYDITLDHDAEFPPGSFTLVSAAERFVMPNNIVGVVHDKSSLARKGLAVQNTVIEPGWRGFLTMEVSNHSAKYWFDPLLRLFGFRCGIVLSKGDAIAQVLFHFTDKPVEKPYEGKYQDQARGPQIPLKEDGTPL